VIIRLAKKSIPAIFAEDGENVFRQWETNALEELGNQSGLVIATGGGCVTKARNYPLLHQNGTIIWLKRNIDLLPTDGRPLSQGSRLQEMYAVRKPMYEAFSNFSIDNSAAPEDTIASILAKLEETT